MKTIDKIIVSSTPPKDKNVAWFDGKGIKIPNQGEWKSTGGSGGGSGIEIVESVDKLDPNAPVGSLASVAVPGSITETSVRDMQQPDASILDTENGSIITANLSTVSSVSVDPSKVSFDGKDTMLYFCTENIKMMGGGQGAILAITTSLQEDVYTQGGMYMNTGTYEQKLYMFVQKDAEGTITVYQDQIDEFVKYFEGNTFYYLGFFEHMSAGVEITEEDYVSLDNIKVVSVIPSVVNVYTKKDSWEKLYEKDLKELNNELTKKAEVIQVQGVSYNNLIIPNVYNIKTNNSTWELSLVLDTIKNENIYNEYIIELTCISAPSSVKFVNLDGTEASIIWANGAAPLFTAGVTYLISIANNFGVYSIFPNSL